MQTSSALSQALTNFTQDEAPLNDFLVSFFDDLTIIQDLTDLHIDLSE